jgi:hypothetical protein
LNSIVCRADKYSEEGTDGANRIILAATPDAVYRTPQHPFDDVERVLDTGAV